MKNKNFNNSLCWDCGNSICGGCPWAKSFKPVPGWKAQKRVIKMTDKVTETTFVVEECPMFKDDSARELREKITDEFVISYENFYKMLKENLFENNEFLKLRKFRGIQRRKK